MRDMVKGIVLGLIVTKIAYFIPGVQLVAGLFGGFVAAYVYDDGPIGGMKAGLLKGLAIFIPALFLAGILSSLLSDLPLIGEFLGGSILILAILITVYTTIKAVIGGFIGGYAAQMARSQMAESDAPERNIR